MIKAIRTSAFAVLTLTSICANAQNGVNSPYSRFGFGLMADRSMGFNKGMGGIAQGYRDGQAVNTANPASYSACDSITALFDLGMSFQNGNFEMGGLQKNARNTSLDYAAFHFRAIKGLGVAVSILPYSNIGYSFASSSQKVSQSDDLTYTQTYTGSGGLHQVMLGAGWKVFKPLSIGANISYLYGDYSHGMTLSYNNSSVNQIITAHTADISTYKLDLGVQYSQKLAKNDFLTIGATYSFGHDINNDAYRTVSNYSNTDNTNISTTDTLKNAFQLPATIAAGFTYTHGYSLLIGADFELQKWGDCRFPSSSSDFKAKKGFFNDRMKISAGVAWTPDPTSTSSYAKHITYKVGGYYAKPYVNTEDLTLTKKPKEFGLTAGVTVPIMNKNTSWNNSTPKVNISLQWVHTDVPYTAEKSLKENYLKLCLGVTISDRWFRQWKVQ